MRRFAALYDLHFGYETVGGHKKTLHDPAALNTTLKFLSDFKPQDLILGGDILDCGAVSHWTKHKPRKTEGMRLLRDAEECRAEVLDPLEAILPREGKRIYLIGNHEDWLDDAMDADPALEGLLDIRRLLGLGKWQVQPQGEGIDYGKLHYIHGDTVGGGEHCAKKGVIDYGQNVRFGHYHTYQVFTKTSPIKNKLPHTGIALPCLCTKDVGYNEKKPSRWVQGFQWGYMSSSGVPFEEHIAIIINGTLSVMGKVYRG